MIKILQFVNYYLRKRLSVLLGHHRTQNPLDIRWRWHYWINNYEEIGRNAKRKTGVAASKLNPFR